MLKNDLCNRITFDYVESFLTAVDEKYIKRTGVIRVNDAGGKIKIINHCNVCEWDNAVIESRGNGYYHIKWYDVATLGCNVRFYG